MEDDLITTKEVGDYRIKVYYCRDSECPITNWGLFGSFFFLNTLICIDCMMNAIGKLSSTITSIILEMLLMLL